MGRERSGEIALSEPETSKAGAEIEQRLGRSPIVEHARDRDEHFLIQVAPEVVVTTLTLRALSEVAVDQCQDPLANLFR